jgi:phospholipid/cholesterol/gamma-HCH transport system substrate-binding protein
MAARARTFRLGLFVLGAGGLFVALLAFILQNSFQRDRSSYFILFEENVKGMVIGSKVNFQGVPIGLVRDIRFQAGRTLVEVSVDPTRASIQNLTRARLDRLLVTGQVTVELEGYGPEGRALTEGEFIEPKADPLHSLTGSLPEVVADASRLMQRLDTVLARVERMLGDENQAHLAAVLANLDRATAPLAERLDAVLAPIERAAARLADETVPEATAALRDVRATAAAMQRLEGEFAGVAREAHALAAGLRGPAQSALGSLRAALDDVRGLARQLKLAPDSILFGISPPASPGGGER